MDNLQLDLLKVTAQHDKVSKERDAMEVERDKLVAENASLGDEICAERQLGFDQGVAQCHYFFQTPLTHPDFDIMKIYMDGKLVDLSSQLAPAPDPLVNATAPDGNALSPPAEPQVASNDPSPGHPST